MKTTTAQKLKKSWTNLNARFLEAFQGKEAALSDKQKALLKDYRQFATTTQKSADLAQWVVMLTKMNKLTSQVQGAQVSPKAAKALSELMTQIQSSYNRRVVVQTQVEKILEKHAVAWRAISQLSSAPAASGYLPAAIWEYAPVKELGQALLEKPAQLGEILLELAGQSERFTATDQPEQILKAAEFNLGLLIGLRHWLVLDAPTKLKLSKAREKMVAFYLEQIKEWPRDQKERLLVHLEPAVAAVLGSQAPADWCQVWGDKKENWRDNNDWLAEVSVTDLRKWKKLFQEGPSSVEDKKLTKAMREYLLTEVKDSDSLAPDKAERQAELLEDLQQFCDLTQQFVRTEAGQASKHDKLSPEESLKVREALRLITLITARTAKQKDIHKLWRARMAKVCRAIAVCFADFTAPQKEKVLKTLPKPLQLAVTKLTKG